jgi:hypothetical protein
MKYTLIALAVAYQLTAQIDAKRKAEYLLDENDFRIEQNLFKEKIKNPDYQYVVYENDTALIGKILRREDFGKISQNERTEIVKSIKEITGKKIEDSQTIVLNFYYKDSPEPKGSCIDHYLSDTTYKRFLKKQKNLFQVFITEKNYSYKSENTFEDKQDRIRKALFKYPVRCGNYIIIMPNGDFYRKLGEYRQDQIPEKLINLSLNNR